jgi:hypothetical protein
MGCMGHVTWARLDATPAPRNMPAQKKKISRVSARVYTLFFPYTTRTLYTDFYLFENLCL